MDRTTIACLPICLVLAPLFVTGQTTVTPTKVFDLAPYGTTSARSMALCGPAKDKLCYTTLTSFGAQGITSAVWSITDAGAPFKLFEGQLPMDIAATDGNVVYYRTGSGFTGSYDFMFGATNLVQAAPPPPAAPLLVLQPTHVGSATAFDAKVVNGKLNCAMDLGSNSGIELVSIPGTSGPKALVKDIDPGAASGIPDGGVNGTCLFGGKLYFNAKTAAAGFELWTTDGTEAGTQQFSNFTAAGLTDFRVTEMRSTASRVLLSAQNQPGNTELWTCTAEPGSLVLLKEIDPSPTAGSQPGYLTMVGSNTYFAASNGTNGRELWVTDGTTAGTRMVKDLRTGANVSSDPHGLIAFKNQLYFFAKDNAGVVGLYRTDGTSAGTVLCHATNATNYVSSVTTTTGRLYYLSHGQSTVLYRTDGTSANHQKVQPLMREIQPYPYKYGTFVARGKSLFFMADYGGSGTSLYTVVDPTFVPPVIKK
ncbi:MAG: hypothetical protein JNL43_04430 [Flavobacteriales bacterium]|nr:hypothetical protein [Flavobacteriales bacterium]